MDLKLINDGGAPASTLSASDALFGREYNEALIHQLVLHGHVFVVATVRAGTPAPDAVTALWKDGLARRLNVRPLTSTAVDELLGHALGPQICERTRRQIRRVAANRPGQWSRSSRSANRLPRPSSPASPMAAC